MPVQSKFPANMLSSWSQSLNLREIIEAFISFRDEVITRRTKFEPNKARDRAHILLRMCRGDQYDEVVRAHSRLCKSGIVFRLRLVAENGQLRHKLLTSSLLRPFGSQGDTYQLSDVQVRAISGQPRPPLARWGVMKLAKSSQALPRILPNILQIGRYGKALRRHARRARSC